MERGLADRSEGQRLRMIITAKLDRAFHSAAALTVLENLKRGRIDLGGEVWGNEISKLVFTSMCALA